MSAHWLTSSPLRLVLSHTFTLLLALGIGLATWYSRHDAGRSILSAVAQQPLTNAAVLFRFGSPGHARILLEELERTPSVSPLPLADTMVFELRLAALGGEHQSSSGEAPHLAAALVACRGFRTKCELDDMRKMAGRFAELRRVGTQGAK